MKLLAFCLFIGGVVSLYLVVDMTDKNAMLRTPASIPEKYDLLSACEKQDVLWEKIVATKHDNLPSLSKFGAKELFKMSFQELSLKGNQFSDFSPVHWRKYLHRRGSIAKIRIVSRDSKYTGIFQGAECGLLRLSLTYKVVGSKPVAPGLALKVLRDKFPSANISALVSLDGQNKDYNFFRNPLSNIVAAGDSSGHKLVHHLFKRVTAYPEELLANDMAKYDSFGREAKAIVSPRQIFFVPVIDMKFKSEQHDVREDFQEITEGTVIYQVRVVPDKYQDFNYSDYDELKKELFLKESIHIADIVTTSEFIASEFGDEGIFFRHQLR